MVIRNKKKFFLVVSVVAIESLARYPNCSTILFSRDLFCESVPEEYRVRICGRDENYMRSVWFQDACHMEKFNKFCNTCKTMKRKSITNYEII